MDQFRFLTDEDFDNRILRGLIRRLPELDVVRVQDVGLGVYMMRSFCHGLLGSSAFYRHMI